MKIVDLHYWQEDCHYVGRAMRRSKRRPALPGSDLANTYKIGHHQDPIALYRLWLYFAIRHRYDNVLAELGRITEDSVLGCWCVGRKPLEGIEIFTAPEICHAQVIAKAWKWLSQQMEGSR